MRKLISKLFRARKAARTAPELLEAVLPTPAPSLDNPRAKRKYLKGKLRHPAPRGAVHGDINGNLIEQARQAQGKR